MAQLQATTTNDELQTLNQTMTHHEMAQEHEAKLQDPATSHAQRPGLGPFTTTSPRGHRRPPLHVAASKGSTIRLKSLLGEGVPVDEVDIFGQTALFHAAESGNAKCASMLIASHASLEAADDGGWTALHAACVSENSTGVIGLLIEAGANIERRDVEGCTPLYLAANGESVEAVIVMLNAGADPLAKGAKGRDAVWYMKRFSAEQKNRLRQAGVKREFFETQWVLEAARKRRASYKRAGSYFDGWKAAWV